MTANQYDMISELCEVDYGLSSWEMNFVNSISHKKREDDLTKWQIKKLEEVWQKAFK